MTPRPEDVALLRRIEEIEARANTASQGPWFVWRTETRGITVQRAAGFVAEMSARGTEADAEFIAHAREDVSWLAAQLRALASRLEGEGRDGERLDWLEARGVSSIYFALGGQFNPGLMRLRPAIDAAMQSAAPASSPQPTTTTEEHAP